MPLSHTPSPANNPRTRTTCGLRALRHAATPFVLSVALTVVAASLVGGCATVGPYTQTVHAAAKPVVHKGVPRSGAAGALPPAAGSTVALQGYTFGAEAVEVSDVDTEHLRLVLGARSSYASFSGEKKCGGFHPDYAVQWSDGEHQYLTLICFGCDEFKVFGPDMAERYDMARGISPQLESLLTGKGPATTEPVASSAAGTTTNTAPGAP